MNYDINLYNCKYDYENILLLGSMHTQNSLLKMNAGASNLVSSGGPFVWCVGRL